MADASAIDALLATGQCIVLDGALTTELEAGGYDLSSALWSAPVLRDHPEAIYNVHLNYYKAGANVATTASYQATELGLRQHLGLNTAQSYDLIQQSVKLAQKARDDVLKADQTGPGRVRELLVAGSVGPYGAYLANGAEYTGDYSLPEAEMQSFHRARIEALVEAGADLLACETMPSFPEIQALLALLKNEFPSTRAWVSCTLRDAEHLSDGTPISKVVEAVNASHQVIAFGYNCIPEQDVSKALDAIQGLTQKPLVAYPNSGEQWDAQSRTWRGGRAQGQSLAQLVLDWQEKGARLIGGCCRTWPRDIGIIKAALQSQ